MASSWYFNNTTQTWSYNNNTQPQNYNVPHQQVSTTYNYPAETAQNNHNQLQQHHNTQHFPQTSNPQNYYVPNYDVTTRPVDNPSYYTSIQHYNLADTLTKKQYVGPDVLYKCTESPVGSIPNSPILGRGIVLEHNVQECQGFSNNLSNYQGEQSNYANQTFSRGCGCVYNPR